MWETDVKTQITAITDSPPFPSRSQAALCAKVLRLRRELAAAVAQQQVNAVYSLVRTEAISLVTGQGDDTQAIGRKSNDTPPADPLQYVAQH